MFHNIAKALKIKFLKREQRINSVHSSFAAVLCLYVWRGKVPMDFTDFIGSHVPNISLFNVSDQTFVVNAILWPDFFQVYMMERRSYGLGPMGDTG